MQRVTLEIPAAGYEAGDAFEVFSNADAAGRAISEIDYTRPITGARPIDFFPLGGEPDESIVREIVSPRLYFGWYGFAVRTRDAVGNVTEDEDFYPVLINSGPGRVTGLRHAATEAGRPVFAFTPPAQMR